MNFLNTDRLREYHQPNQFQTTAPNPESLRQPNQKSQIKNRESISFPTQTAAPARIRFIKARMNTDLAAPLRRGCPQQKEIKQIWKGQRPVRCARLYSAHAFRPTPPPFAQQSPNNRPQSRTPAPAKSKISNQELRIDFLPNTDRC
ncbi:MAG: hypothetical protein WA952_21155, partial [Lewinella sp.]